MLINLVGICLILGKFLSAASTSVVDEAIETIEVATPKVAKSNFIVAINHRKLERAQSLAEENPFLVNQFNSDIFAAILACYSNVNSPSEDGDEHVCDPFYNLVAAGLDNLAMSKTTPMIMAVAANNYAVFHKLLKEDIKFLEAYDASVATPLMYAAILDHEYMMIQIIRNLGRMNSPKIWINLADCHGQTALHYICESTRSEADKLRWIRVLVANGARVTNTFCYSADLWALELRKEITELGGRVENTNLVKLMAMMSDILKNTGLALLSYYRVELLDLFVPHLFTIWQSMPLRAFQAFFFYLGQMILPGFDSNVVVSFDLPSGVYHFSINLIMLAFIFICNWKEMKELENNLKY